MTDLNAKPLVLHLAVDYPNVYRPENTMAVRNFVNANQNIEHIIFALTRTANPFKVAKANGDGNGDHRVISMRYWGFPFGVLLALSMWIVALRVRKEIKLKNISPKLVHAHKLTFEGLAGWWLARWLSIPLVISVRGEAESKILRFKPHYKLFLQRILSDATKIYYVSAWFKPLLNQKFQIEEVKQKLLPNFVANRALVFNDEPQQNRLLTVLDLNVFRKKGLDRLLLAFRDCLATYPNAHLDVIGRGEPAVVAEVKQLVSKSELDENVSLLGVMPNEKLQASLPLYAGMALPSHNETFGMVYVESLLAGVPILYSKGTGIDGFVDFVEAKVAVDPLDTSSILEGLLQLLKNQNTYHQWLVENRNNIQQQFDQCNYVLEYQELVRNNFG